MNEVIGDNTTLVTSILESLDELVNTEWIVEIKDDASEVLNTITGFIAAMLEHMAEEGPIATFQTGLKGLAETLMNTSTMAGEVPPSFANIRGALDQTEVAMANFGFAWDTGIALWTTLLEMFTGKDAPEKFGAYESLMAGTVDFTESEGVRLGGIFGSTWSHGIDTAINQLDIWGAYGISTANNLVTGISGAVSLAAGIMVGDF